MGLHFDTRSDGAPLAELDASTDREVCERVAAAVAEGLDDEEVMERVLGDLFTQDDFENELLQEAVAGYLAVTERPEMSQKVAA